MGNVIELRNVNKVYRGTPDVQVLFDITLSFSDRSFNSIVGESGSGKSTLLNLIGSLDRPTSGEVIVDGVSTAALSSDGLAEVRNRTLGFVFQFHYLLPEFTAMENALMPYVISHGKAGRQVTDWADELFELVGIAKVKNNPAMKMSGGQQQRTAIVRALINKPRVVLADEPTGNLDSENTANIYKRFREINERYGTTFIIVTHDRRIAEQTDRIVEVRDGRLLMDISK
ncbi:MAG: ABC transporter ATP-binding protein [Dehalococcoidia bacterium]|jgi:lipoprotein-releasing system ATP-binding protein|nr:ABC transporter ATP-binding protein [Dehalococcoidia bacterium]